MKRAEHYEPKATMDLFFDELIAMPVCKKVTEADKHLQDKLNSAGPGRFISEQEYKKEKGKKK